MKSTRKSIHQVRPGRSPLLPRGSRRAVSQNGTNGHLQLLEPELTVPGNLIPAGDVAALENY